MVCLYNSHDEMYKKPFGAVKTDETVDFTLTVPSRYRCRTPYLFIKEDGGDFEKIPLARGAKEKDTDVFTLRYTPPRAGLYFYYFDLWVGYRKLYRGLLGRAVEKTEEPGELYQLTVYDADYTTPQSAHGGIMYQIFPDRFFEGDPHKMKEYNERVYRSDKENEPYFWPVEMEDGFLTMDYFGGDLIGIEKKLPFLKSLGVSWLYLNPIFEAHSNHRYNTADYLTVDPYLGSNEDFERLCAKAAECGIKIILDGVFSHTGSDSIYFNKEGRYPSFGAWQGPASRYRDWYLFNPDGSYESWWGFDTLPECNKENRAYRDFICGEGGVIDHWLQLGAAGFRLDVADELPDDFIAEIRRAVKRNGDDNLLIGEVWEDASNKMAYGKRRRYFLGNELDGVMNYPFRTAILEFLKAPDALAFKEAVLSVVENYPPPAMAACTTHLSTHDTVRAITELAGDPVSTHGRAWQSGRQLTPEQYHLGMVRLRLAFVLQYTLPGMPCVYYGDEIAMQGYKDPFNRGYYNWHSHETELIELLQQLADIRNRCDAFKDGTLRFIHAKGGLLVYRREGGGATAEIAINCTGHRRTLELLGETVELQNMHHAIRTSN